LPDSRLIRGPDEALTKLLENPGFVPRRTVILAHGFDEEEVGARQGAGRIAPFLEERYGKDGVLLLVDEGTGTVDGLWGGAWALPANAEKGYLDVKVRALLVV
jgi:Gly-Xaa carboxypeptidase